MPFFVLNPRALLPPLAPVLPVWALLCADPFYAISGGGSLRKSLGGALLLNGQARVESHAKKPAHLWCGT